MGIFDKKGKARPGEEFDSPVEKVELRSKSGADQGDVITKDMTQRPQPGAVPIQQDYGIEEAIALMRTLPKENVDLVVKVMKQTLESTNIDISAIIQDATSKEDRIKKAISTLKVEITDLETDIESRNEEIESLEAEREETALVKERLKIALQG